VHVIVRVIVAVATFNSVDYSSAQIIVLRT